MLFRILANCISEFIMVTNFLHFVTFSILVHNIVKDKNFLFNNSMHIKKVIISRFLQVCVGMYVHVCVCMYMIVCTQIYWSGNMKSVIAPFTLALFHELSQPNLGKGDSLFRKWELSRDKLEPPPGVELTFILHLSQPKLAQFANVNMLISPPGLSRAALYNFALVTS